MKRTITPHEIDVLAPFIAQLTGLVLDHSKAYLFETRLGPVLEKYNLDSFENLIQGIALNKSIERDTIDAITTQETLFFRDRHPFDFIQNSFFPQFFEKNGMQKELNIWSAASSTGQEIYSIGMILGNILFDLSKYNINLMGTDISEEALEKARNGIYNKFELSRGIDIKLLNKYFTKDGNNYQIREELRKMVSFKKANLLKTLPQLPKMDLVFCRNVAIYFARDDREILYNKIADQMKENAVLIISSTESLINVTDRFNQGKFKDTFYYTKKS
ncbi:MAG: protein-glutamate O-methyltransferase CheR [Lentisphaeraceae bacterium]|nr:protein-glutamate O-methyltransferase CheR [Lentisphaeraceae bacterium]